MTLSDISQKYDEYFGMPDNALIDLAWDAVEDMECDHPSQRDEHQRRYDAIADAMSDVARKKLPLRRF
jgi:hypothetical protein